MDNYPAHWSPLAEQRGWDRTKHQAALDDYAQCKARLTEEVQSSCASPADISFWQMTVRAAEDIMSLTHPINWLTEEEAEAE